MILVSIWNNLSTAVNAVGYLDNGQTWAAAFSIFFLFFPGPVAFAVFYHLDLLIPDRPLVRRFLFAISLIFCYPVVPAYANTIVLVTGEHKHKHQAFLLKAFEASLDDGPHFVLRLIVALLKGLPKYSFIFFSSMLTSFIALALFGLRFNEKKTDKWIKWLVAFPMLVTSLGARAFILAVYIMKTAFSPHKDNHEWIWGPTIFIIFYVLFNIVIFMICGHDLKRSVIFGLCSTLIPAGYNYDENFNQQLTQPLANPATDGIRGGVEQDVLNVETHTLETKIMRSWILLLWHWVLSLCLMAFSTFFTKISEEACRILGIAQILIYLSGSLFSVARGSLMVPNRSRKVQGIIISLTLTAYASLVLLLVLVLVLVLYPPAMDYLGARFG